MKGLKKIINIIIDIVVVLILIVSLLVVVMSVTSRATGVPNLFGIAPISVTSNSMEDTLMVNDLIFCEPRGNAADKYEVGDIVTFSQEIAGEQALNTHRIVEISDNNGTISYITRGDNNLIDDNVPVYPSDLVGKWGGVKIAGAGKVLDFLRSKTGFFICVVIPMALFFLFELYKFIATLVESKQKMSADEEEEIKRKAVEEYLAKQAEQAAAAAAATTTETATENVERVAEDTTETVTEAVEETVTE